MYFVVIWCLQEHGIRSSLARLGVKFCRLQEQIRIDNATSKAGIEISYVGTNAQAIFEKILNTFDGSTDETKGNIHDLETMITSTTSQGYTDEQFEIYGNFLHLIGLQLQKQDNDSKEEYEVKNDFSLRIDGNVSIKKRESLLKNIDCLYDVFNAYQTGGVDGAIGCFRNIDLFAKMLSDLGIDMSDESLKKYGFAKHSSGIFDEKFIIFTLQQMVVENTGGETGMFTFLCVFGFSFYLFVFLSF